MHEHELSQCAHRGDSAVSLAQYGKAIRVAHMHQLGRGCFKGKFPLYGFQVSRTGHRRVSVVVMAEHNAPGTQKIHFPGEEMRQCALNRLAVDVAPAGWGQHRRVRPKITQTLSSMQEQRIRVDYDPTARIPRSQVMAFKDRVEDATRAFVGVPAQTRRSLAVYLLVRRRN